MMRYLPNLLGRTTLLLGALSVLSLASHAQTIYRIVGPDGRVSFSDQAPSGNEKVTPLSPSGKAALAGSANLPTALRNVVERFPVTLYTAIPCAPCDQGRAMLQQRGIPFSERTINAPEDSQVLQRLAGTSAVPVLGLGGQILRGFSAPEWSQYLDTAGYPAQSALPPTWRNPPPAPLVPPEKAAEPASSAPAPRGPAAARPSTTDNPAGIVF